jgi:hypothetical protein
MSIVQDLYNIFDNERSKRIARKSSKNLVVLELSQNLAFLREGLAENLDSSAIIAGLEDNRFNSANEKGTNFNTIQKKVLSKSTYGAVKEFEKYKGWSTEKLINKAYERLATLKKLNVNSRSIDVRSRLQYLFKYLMVLMAHIEEKHLSIKSRRTQ